MGNRVIDEVLDDKEPSKSLSGIRSYSKDNISRRSDKNKTIMSDYKYIL
jgi:hypothetical protein